MFYLLEFMQLNCHFMCYYSTSKSALFNQATFVPQTAREQSVKALVLTPTKELCNQAYKNLVVST